ncbi:uncharacterized protein LOC126267735 [Schistocerca gregaria]|uniref:uncharacterized protein LOC126267735 n=1 Tax=Schistocerca gregaria TaxID=7010 RepID=UPI00211EDBCD|nr:uncharacterized protein LOC126267735 [Schistocerca gregaria]
MNLTLEDGDESPIVKCEMDGNIIEMDEVIKVKDEESSSESQLEQKRMAVRIVEAMLRQIMSSLNSMESSMKEDISITKTDMTSLKDKLKKEIKMELKVVSSGLSELNKRVEAVGKDCDEKIKKVVHNSNEEFNDLPEIWNDKEKMTSVRGLLKGDAYGWAAQVADSCTSWKSFEKAFLDEYWSKEKQQRILSEFWGGERFGSWKGTVEVG